MYYGSYINFLIYFLPYLKFNTFEFSKVYNIQVLRSAIQPTQILYTFVILDL